MNIRNFFHRRKNTSRIVYFGPPTSGKSTSIYHIYNNIPNEMKDDIIYTESDPRILSFEINPSNNLNYSKLINISTISGVSSDYVSAAKKIMLNSQGVVFVADSQRDKLQENIDYMKILAKILKGYNIDFQSFPIVIQYNKRDLQDILSVHTLNKYLNYPGLNRTVFESTAHLGINVMETFYSICNLLSIDL